MAAKNLITLLLLFSLVSSAQQLPEAPAPPNPKFFSGLNKWTIIGSIAARSFDAAQSCYHYAHGYRETMLPGQGCATVSAWSAGLTLGGIATSWFLHRHHHSTLALAPTIFNIEAPVVASIETFAAHRKRTNLPAPLPSCNEGCITVRH